jgi:hypothetical protein
VANFADNDSLSSFAFIIPRKWLAIYSKMKKDIDELKAWKQSSEDETNGLKSMKQSIEDK